MNRITNLREYVAKIDMSFKYSLDTNLREIAIVRKLLIELSKLFYRDTIFFMNKEALDIRTAIYDSTFDIEHMTNYAIACKSYSKVIKQLLESVFNIGSELISSGSDTYRHVDLLIVTSVGRKYIVDPLMDLIEFQVGWKTKKFASIEKLKNEYNYLLNDVDFLTDNEIETIDTAIGYKKNWYENDFYDLIYDDLINVEEFLYFNPSISYSILGTTYGISYIPPEETLPIKIRIINQNFYKGKSINSIADLYIYIKLLLEYFLPSYEIENLKLCSFFVDERDLKDELLKGDFFSTRETRKRGVCISCHGKTYLYTYSTNKVIEIEQNMWDRMVEENKIFVKKNYFIKLLGYMKKTVDRNLIHHSEFLRLFSQIESMAIEKNVELINYLNITREYVEVSHVCDVVFYIMNNKLRILCKKSNVEYEVDYLDEGRNVIYRKVNNLD